MSRLPLVIYPLDELVAIARAGSAFYRKFYQGLPEHPAITEIPIVEQQSYWGSHHHDKGELLTAKMIGGVVVFSGGSTGAAKFSFFTDEEWRSTIAMSVLAYNETGMQDGDRVANLFAAGSLYTSFLLATESLRESLPNVVQFPIGYFTPVADIVRFVRTFNINVLAGLPSHILAIVDYIDKEGFSDVHFARLLFAGEPFSPDQRAFMEKRFPGVQIRSLGYASVDAGVMGLADASCGPGEHRVYDGATILEIVDEESGEIIDQPGQPGRIVFTNLTRRLMPMIRYPSGDRGQWMEPPSHPSRKFQLLGRSEESARLSHITLEVSDISDALQPFRERLGIRQFQLLISHFDMRDQLTLRLVGQASPEALVEGRREIVESLIRARPLVGKMVTDGIHHPIEVAWIEAKDLIVTSRTGKVRMVVDQRITSDTGK